VTSSAQPSFPAHRIEAVAFRHRLSSHYADDMGPWQRFPGHRSDVISPNQGFPGHRHDVISPSHRSRPIELTQSASGVDLRPIASTPRAPVDDVRPTPLTTTPSGMDFRPMAPAPSALGIAAAPPRWSRQLRPWFSDPPPRRRGPGRRFPATASARSASSSIQDPAGGIIGSRRRLPTRRGEAAGPAHRFPTRRTDSAGPHPGHAALRRFRRRGTGAGNCGKM
jgi:hypothetical protein